MTSEGTPAGILNRNFEQALRAGDLPMAIAAAKDLPAMTLERSARLLFLMAVKESPLLNRASARWMERYVTETSNLTPAQIADVADALAGLPAVDAAEALIAAARNAY